MKSNYLVFAIAIFIIVGSFWMFLSLDGTSAGTTLIRFYDNLYAIILDAFGTAEKVGDGTAPRIVSPKLETACGPEGCDGTCLPERVCLNSKEVKITSSQCRLTYETCDVNETCRNGACENRHEKILAFWSPYVDTLNASKWNAYREAAAGVIARGFTHVGFRVFAPTQNQGLVAARVGELRTGGYKLGLIQTPGHIFITKNDELDLATHPANGLNLKYFDSTGLDVLNCSFKCDGEPDTCCNGQDYVTGPNCPAENATNHNCGCVSSPSTRAIDPAYNGAVWQKELDFIDETFDAATLLPDDLALVDMEVWSRPSYVETCYPGTFMSSSERYTGANLQARYDEYYNYRGDRAEDVRNQIKARHPDNTLLFFNENIPELATANNTAVPPGSGDAASPNIYRGSNLAAVEDYLDQGDYSGSYVWISFSTVRSDWVDTDTGEDWLTLKWDPRITQKFGKMLNDEGVAGVIVYPGPTQHEVPVDYYYDHSRYLVRGLVGGLDPGVLSEVCGDGIDNDGDGQSDEADACAPPSPCAPGDTLLDNGQCSALITADTQDRVIGFRTQQAYGYSWEAMQTATSSPVPNYYASNDPFLYGPANTYTPTSRKLYRVAIPFDTARLPDEAVIELATLKLVLNGYNFFGTDKNYASVVNVELAEAPGVTEADYGGFGSVEGADERLYVGSLSSGAPIIFDLNETGKSWINPLGWTTLGLRAGLDLEGVILREYQFANFGFHSADSAGVEPQLEIVYSPSLR